MAEDKTQGGEMNETYTAIIWATLEPFNGEGEIIRDIPSYLVERSEEDKKRLKDSPFFQVF